MLNIQIKIQNENARRSIAALGSAVQDRREMNAALGADLEDLTSAHIRIAAQTRHNTASRLGAAPSGYLTNLAGSVESRADQTGAEISVYGDIFKRVLGPVEVQPTRRKWLTIPAAAESYNRRAGEFGGLYFVKSGPESARLQDKTGKVLFWLKKRVTLPQDRGLLPSDAQYEKAAVFSINQFLDKRIAALSQGGYSRS